MSAGNNGRFPAGSAERRILRAAVALDAATMLGTVGVSTANAEPSADPISSVVSTAEDPADSAADIEATITSVGRQLQCVKEVFATGGCTLGDAGRCDATVWAQEHNGFGVLIEPPLKHTRGVADDDGVWVIASSPMQF